MKGFDKSAICQRCGRRSMKSADELSDDEKMLVERLPGSAEFTAAERKKHRFCTQCWFEEVPDRELPA